MTLLPDDDDCALNIAFVPLQPVNVKIVQFHRIPSRGHHYKEVTVDDVGSLSFRSAKGSDQTFSFSFILPGEDKGYFFKGIKIWPEGAKEPDHAVPLPAPGEEKVIYEDKSVSFKVRVGVENGRVMQLRIYNEYRETGEFDYALDIVEDGGGKISRPEIDPRIYNTWEPGEEGRPGCLGGWTAFLRSRR